MSINLTFDELIAAAPDEEAPAPATNVLSLTAGQPTMSSLQIAEITGKPHRNVTIDIERILKEAEIDVQGFLHIYRDTQNREQKCYILPRRECDLVVSGYSVPYRLAIIDRWQELEAKQAPVNPLDLLNDPNALRNMLIGYTEQVIALENKVQTLAPKAAGLDLIAGTEGSLNITAAAKNLEIQPKRLFDYMSSHGWIYKRGAEWLPYETKCSAGLMTCKVVPYTASDSSVRTTTQARITSKGIARLAELLSASA